MRFRVKAKQRKNADLATRASGNWAPAGSPKNQLCAPRGSHFGAGQLLWAASVRKYSVIQHGNPIAYCGLLMPCNILWIDTLHSYDKNHNNVHSF